MGVVLDTITANVTAAAAGGSAMAAVAGDSLTVRATNAGKTARLLQVWADVQTAGFFQITSPKFHDNTRGLRFRTVISEPKPLLPWGAYQTLYQTDTLALTLAAGAVAGDIESVSMLVYYEDIQGGAARLIDTDTMRKRMVEMVTVEDTITTTAAGGYTGGEAINAESDLLKADTDYALLGYRVQTECASVCYRGADTSNFRVSGPGDDLGADYTSSWFVWLSNFHQLPLIPVFNSNNRGGILVDCVQDENAAAVQISHVFARLA